MTGVLTRIHQRTSSSDQIGTHPVGASAAADAIAAQRGANAPAPSLAFTLSIAQLKRSLTAIVSLLVAGTFVAQFMKSANVIPGLARFFDADVKVNFPTGFKVFSLAGCAALAWIISRAARATHDGLARRGTLLAIVMAFLTIDEMAYVHQSLASFMGEHTGGSGGIFHFAWILVYLPIAVAVSIYFIPLLLDIRPHLRAQLIAAGVLFAGGSGGIEMVKGHIAGSSGENSLAFYLTTAVSDSAEMIGLAIMTVALAQELHRRMSEARVRIVEHAEAERSPAGSTTVPPLSTTQASVTEASVGTPAPAPTSAPLVTAQ